MMLLAAILLIPLTVAQICKNPIDLSNGTLTNGTIEYEGIIYQTGEDYIGNRSTEESACDCGKKPCIRKCCPPGYAISNINKSKVCVLYSKDLIWPFEDGTTKSMFNVLYGTIVCRKKGDKKIPRVRALSLESNIALTNDGNLRIYTEYQWSETQSYSYSPDNYCLDTFVDRNSDNPVEVVDALVCEHIDAEFETYPIIWRSVCMLISSVFILATLVVYGWLPELRNLHGRVLMCYLSCLLAGFLIMGGLRLKTLSKIKKDLCYPLGVTAYYSLTAAFFWLNVMCFDIYWTFSGRRGLSLGKLFLRGQFFVYCVYAFGSSILLTTLLLALEHSGIKSPYMPNFRDQGCFLFGTSRLIYFYGPMIILCVMNTTFFVMTAWRIFRVNKQTSVLNSSESNMHSQQRSENEKQRFLLYFKLFIVMGVSWIFEVISSFFEKDYSIFFIISDVINLLMGAIIFCLFVCKKKIFKLIKNRLVENFHVQEFRMNHLTHCKWKKKCPRDSIETVRTTVDNDFDIRL